jgi:hypothetical protein
MHKLSRWTIGMLLVTPLAVVGCDTRDPAAEPIPAGASVDPPRRAAETGSMAVPGDEPTEPMPVGATEPVPADTMTPPVQEPGT